MDAGLFERAGLLIDALAEFTVALRDLRAGCGHAFGVLAHIGHYFRQVILHALERAQQFGSLVLASRISCHLQIAASHGPCHVDGLAERADDRAAEQHATNDTRSAH
jgi:hypothetical protein